MNNVRAYLDCKVCKKKKRNCIGKHAPLTAFNEKLFANFAKWRPSKQGLNVVFIPDVTIAATRMARRTPTIKGTNRRAMSPMYKTTPYSIDWIHNDLMSYAILASIYRNKELDP